MKKIIAVVCFSLVSLGVSATSALAANDVAANASISDSKRSLQYGSVNINRMLAERKEISLVVWSENIRKIFDAKTEQEAKVVYDDLLYKLMIGKLLP